MYCSPLETVTPLMYLDGKDLKDLPDEGIQPNDAYVALHAFFARERNY